MKACGVLLLVGSPLLIAGFLVHPPEVPDVDTNRATVAAHEDAARLSHSLILGGILAIACAGPMAALGAVRSGQPTGQIVGPIVATVGALAALPLVAIEATVLPSAAAAGDAAAFNAWSELGSAFWPGFFVFVGGLGLIAFYEARNATGVLRIISNVAAALAAAAIVGWIGAFYFGIWALNYLTYGMLGVFVWLGFGAAMELFGPHSPSSESRATTD